MIVKANTSSVPLLLLELVASFVSPESVAGTPYDVKAWSKVIVGVEATIPLSVCCIRRATIKVKNMVPPLRGRKELCNLQKLVREVMILLRGFCLECAIRHHDYKEILAHGESDDSFSASPLPAAWIDGRRYSLAIPIGRRGTKCSECAKRVATIYLPID